MQSPVRLTGSVKHYDWGGTVFLPQLLRLSNSDGRPFAEYWMGVHPQAECRVSFPDGREIALRDYISSAPVEALGQYVLNRFQNLPYLFKALDVRDMLSIQVHPSKAEAERDFQSENEKGTPRSSPSRNYKDDNHKPELMVAIGEFWLLHGFKPEEELIRTLSNEAALSFLLPIFQSSGYAGLYRHVMEMPQEVVNERLQPLLDRILPLYAAGRLGRSSADYWAAKGTLTFSQPGRIDRGIFSVYLFNLVRLQRGEAVFQDAGVPHAYLEGQNVEIMASSDNVLRGGLTNKHIDVKELLRHVKCEPTVPNILKGDPENGLLVYHTTAPDFELSAIHLDNGITVSFQPSTAEMLLLVEGEATVESEGNAVVLRPGEPSAIVFPGRAVQVGSTAKALVYRATVPSKS